MNCRIYSLLVVLFLLSCRPNPTEKLSRIWKPVEVTGEGINDDNKKDFLKEGNRMEFTKDGKFISFSAGLANDTGSYILSQDGRTLRVTTSKGKQTEFSINELKRNRAILENKGVVLVLEPVQ